MAYIPGRIYTKDGDYSLEEANKNPNLAKNGGVVVNSAGKLVNSATGQVYDNEAAANAYLNPVATIQNAVAGGTDLTMKGEPGLKTTPETLILKPDTKITPELYSGNQGGNANPAATIANTVANPAPSTAPKAQTTDFSKYRPNTTVIGGVSFNTSDANNPDNVKMIQNAVVNGDNEVYNVDARGVVRDNSGKVVYEPPAPVDYSKMIMEAVTQYQPAAPTNNTDQITNMYAENLKSLIAANQAKVNKGVSDQQAIIAGADAKYQPAKNQSEKQRWTDLISVNEAAANAGDRGGNARQMQLDTQTNASNRMNDINMAIQAIKDGATRTIADLQAAGRSEEAQLTAENAAQRIQAVIAEGNRIDEINRGNSESAYQRIIDAVTIGQNQQNADRDFYYGVDRDKVTDTGYLADGTQTIAGKESDASIAATTASTTGQNIANSIAAIDLSKYDEKTKLEIQGLQNDVAAGTISNEMAAAQLKEYTDPNSVTNQMNRLGLDTAKINYAILDKTQQAEITKILNDATKGTIDIAIANAELKEITDPNSLTNRLKKANVDTAELTLKYLEPSLKAEAESILLDLEGKRIDNATASAALKELTDPNSLTNRLKKLEVDTASINLKYLEPSLKAEAESIALDLAGKRIDNKTAEAALKELADPNSLTNKLKKLEVDTATLNLKYLDDALKAEADSVALDLENKKIDKKIAEAQLKELTDKNSVTNQLKALGLKTEKLNYQYLEGKLKAEADAITQDLAIGKITKEIAQQELDNLKAGLTKEGKNPNAATNSVTYDSVISANSNVSGEKLYHYVADGKSGLIPGTNEYNRAITYSQNKYYDEIVDNFNQGKYNNLEATLRKGAFGDVDYYKKTLGLDNFNKLIGMYKSKVGA